MADTKDTLTALSRRLNWANLIMPSGSGMRTTFYKPELAGQKYLRQSQGI
jgi:hypothetical protein